MAQDKIFKFDLLSEINGRCDSQNLTPKVGVAYDQVTTNELSEKTTIYQERLKVGSSNYVCF